MKDAEDEAFDELARRQGMWGGGFPAKRRMAADKLHWSDCAVHNGPAYPAGPCDCDARLSKYAETLLEEATRSCNNIDEQRALDALIREAQPAQESPSEREALKLALEALEEAHYKIEHKQNAAKREQAITAIRKALAEAKLKEKNNGT